jgi:hypothetical protein
LAVERFAAYQLKIFIDGEKMKTKLLSNAAIAALVIFSVLTGCANTGATTADGKPGPAAAANESALTWTAVTQSEITYNIRNIAYGGGKFVAGWRTGDGTGEMAYSTDGITWTRVTDSAAGEQENTLIVYEGGKFFASGGPGKIVYSTDGVTWTRVKDDQFSSGIRGPLYVDGKFVVTTYDGRIAHSADGVTWTRLVKTGLYNIADGQFSYTGNKLFAAWGDARLSYSADGGITWTSVEAFSGRYLSGMAYGGGKFVAGWSAGGGRGIHGMAYSTDGITWTAVEDSTIGNPRILSIAYGGGKFVAGGNGGKMAYSEDGVTWTAVDSAFDGTRVYRIAYGGGRFVAVGDNGKIAYSNMQE